MPVVEAAAVFAHAKSKALAQKIEHEMLKAAAKARSEGKNATKIREAMLAAREKVKADLDKPGGGAGGQGGGK